MASVVLLECADCAVHKAGWQCCLVPTFSKKCLLHQARGALPWNIPGWKAGSARERTLCHKLALAQLLSWRAGVYAAIVIARKGQSNRHDPVLADAKHLCGCLSPECGSSNPKDAEVWLCQALAGASMSLGEHNSSLLAFLGKVAAVAARSHPKRCYSSCGTPSCYAAPIGLAQSTPGTPLPLPHVSASSAVMCSGQANVKRWPHDVMELIWFIFNGLKRKKQQIFSCKFKTEQHFVLLLILCSCCFFFLFTSLKILIFTSSPFAW